MAVRNGKDGKLEYYNENKVFNPKYIDKFWDILTGKEVKWPGTATGKKKKPKDPYKGYSYQDYEGNQPSSASSSSCSPEDCPTCNNKACPNSYDDFIDEGDFKL